MRHWIFALLFLLCAARPAPVDARVTQEQAIQAVRELLEMPDLKGTIHTWRPLDGLYGTPFKWPGVCYDIELTAPDWRGSAYVRASDGVVMSTHLELALSAGVPPGPPPARLWPLLHNTGRREAERIAVAFARRHVAGFDKRRWVKGPYGEMGRWGRIFQWTEVLNKQGLLAPRTLHIDVSHARVTDFVSPDVPVTAPLVPQITREEAVRIARPYAPLDPAKYPFRRAQLEIDRCRASSG